MYMIRSGMQRGNSRTKLSRQPLTTRAKLSGSFFTASRPADLSERRNELSLPTRQRRVIAYDKGPNPIGGPRPAWFGTRQIRLEH
jgi:hypothetical protein